MDKKTIETLAVNAVRDSIVLSDYLDQFIADNDKEPSWDGFVYIYKNKSKKKENLRGRVPVQVKGTENSNLSKSEISFQVSLVDLNNYLYDGGVMFFVVYIAQNGLAKQIYYAALPPVKLRMIISEASGQKSKNIKLKRFPTDSNQKAIILVNCLENCQKQSSFTSAKLLSLEELEEQGVLENLTISLPVIEGISPHSTLFSTEVYLYANIKGSSIPQPIEAIPSSLTTAEEKKAKITIGGRLFYNKVVIYQNAHTTRTVLGESFSIEMTSEKQMIKMKYQNSNSIRTLAIDLDFMLTCISHGGFLYNDIEFPLNRAERDSSKFSIQHATDLLEYAKKVVQMLDTLGCKKDINIKALSKQDIRNIDYLITAFVDKQEVSGLKENLPSISTISIANLKFLLYFAPIEGKKGTYNIYDFFKTQFVLGYKSACGDELLISQYAILHANDILALDNIRFDILLPSFQNVKRHHETMMRANFFMLDLINAFDKSDNRVEIIGTAKDFSEWIMTATEEEVPYNIRVLNQLQINKRLRPLNLDEIRELFRLIESPDSNEETLVGVYLLLDQQDLAETHFNKLDTPLQEEFKKYPIYHFWKKI